VASWTSFSLASKGDGVDQFKAGGKLQYRRRIARTWYDMVRAPVYQIKGIIRAPEPKVGCQKNCLVSLFDCGLIR
jgi:hypothetical protein